MTSNTPSQTRAKVLSIIAAKGGVGKTFIASSLGAFFALRNHRTLIGEIEDNMRLYHIATGAGRRGEPPLDDNLTTYSWFTNPRVGIGLSSYAIDMPGLVERVQGINKGALHELRIARKWLRPQILQFVPGSERLRTLENQFAMATSSAASADFDPYLQLAKAIEVIAPAYDVVVLDTPPALSLLQMNIIMASDYVVIVLDFDMDSISDYDRTLRFYKQVASASRQYGRKIPRLLGVVYNRYDAQFTENDVVLLKAYTEPHFDPLDLASETLVPPLVEHPTLGVIADDRRRLTGANNSRQTIHTYAPTSPIGEDTYRMCCTVEAAIGLAASSAR